MEQTDKEHMLRTNQYYIAQVSSMEIKISELKAQLHAKDFEIDYLSSRLSPSKAVYDKNAKRHELELQLSVALQENESLKKQISQIEDINIIKSQLEHALHMKDVFEQKYRELNLQSMVNEKHAELESAKDELIEHLQQELANERAEKMENAKKHEELYKENTDLKQEIIEKNKQLQEMKRKVFTVGMVESEKKVNCGVGVSKSVLERPSSAGSRKGSPDVKKESQLRKNLQFRSPKLGFTTEIVKRPKIVSISLETSILKNFS